MAKIIKLTGYLIATDDDMDEREIAIAAKEILSSKFDCIGKPFTTESADIGIWSDEHKLNYIDCPVSVCEQYFNKSEKVNEENNFKNINIFELNR